MKTERGDRKRGLLSENWQDARFDCQLLIDISAFRKPENQLSVDIESYAVTTLAEVRDARQRHVWKLHVNDRCHLDRIQLNVLLQQYFSSELAILAIRHRRRKLKL